MFYIRIDKKNSSNQTLPPVNQDSYPIQQFQTDHINITIGADKTTTIADQGKKILIATGLVQNPIVNTDLKNAEVTPDNYFQLLGDSLTSMIVINLENNTLSLIRSISCTDSLYYSLSETSFLCSLSITLMKKLKPRFELNIAILPEYYAYRTLLAPVTLAKDIYKLNGGELVQLQLFDRQTIERHQYQFHFASEKQTVPLKEVTERVESILNDNIKFILNQGPNLSVLLSGGLDSSALTILACQHSDDITSFSSDFSFLNKHDRESAYATSMAEQLKVNHTVCPISEEQFLDQLVGSIVVAGEPLNHLQTVCLSLLFRNCESATGRYFLCGEGADALFGAALHKRIYRFKSIVNYLSKDGKHSLLRGVAKYIGHNDDRFRFFSQNFTHNYDDNNHMLWSIGIYGDRNKITELLGCSPDDIFASRRELLEQYTNYDLINKITVMSLMSDVSTTVSLWRHLAGEYGLQLAYPYMCPSLVDYITSIPWQVKLIDLKIIIKEILRKYNVPESLINRPKLSFGFPLRFWALPGAMFQPLVDMAGEMFDQSFLRSLQEDHRGKAMLLWNIINLYLWRKIFIEDIPPEDIKREISDRRVSHVRR